MSRETTERSATAAAVPIEPAPAPRWTRKRVVDMLIDCYGPTKRGRVDVAAIADYAGVSPSTVYRWIAGGPAANQRLARIPEQRRIALQRAPDLVEWRHEQQYQHAINALDKIRSGIGIVPAWRTQGWLNEHTVAIVEIPGKPWRQVIVTNNSMAEIESRRRVTVIDNITATNKFVADIVAHYVMVRQQNWRIHPASNELMLGRTRVWMAGAPRPNLAELLDLARRTCTTKLPARRNAQKRCRT